MLSQQDLPRLLGTAYIANFVLVTNVPPRVAMARDTVLKAAYSLQGTSLFPLDNLSHSANSMFGRCLKFES